MSPRVTVRDGQHRFIVDVREDTDVPDMPTPDRPAPARFIDWWRGECSTRNIPYAYGVAEPQGHRIVRSLLKKYSLERLQELARHFFLDHGDRLRENPNHFAIFTSLIGHMEGELRAREE